MKTPGGPSVFNGRVPQAQDAFSLTLQSLERVPGIVGSREAYVELTFPFR